MDAHRALASRGRESLEETNAGKGQDGNQRNEEKGKSSERYLGEFTNLTIAMETLQFYIPGSPGPIAGEYITLTLWQVPQCFGAFQLSSEDCSLHHL